MKNKLFLSLALLVAANTFIATPAMAYTWANAKRHAAIAGKAALGVACVGAGTVIPVAMYYNPKTDNSCAHVKHPILGVAISLFGGFLGCIVLQDAWNDFKNINN